MTDEIAWPPLYTIKKHARARHVKLKTTVKLGLELVVPKRFNPKEIPAILEHNKAWIIKHLAKIREQTQLLANVDMPGQINLLAFGQNWQVDYVATQSGKLRLMTRPHNELVLFGNINDKDLCKKLLTNWARSQAKKLLPLRIEQLSNFCQLPFQNVSIRNQQSRWGSCSVEKNINLNYKLIFLPPELMDYIIIHELCHTEQLNHSAKFWRLVAKFDVGWKEHCKASRNADGFIPVWLV
ncbi:MAG: SprT family zinc-dependent metalloprotease [Pseudomonadota bacterium]